MRTEKKRIEDRIVEAVCWNYGCSLEEIRGKGGSRDVCDARRMLVYILSQFTLHGESWLSVFVGRDKRWLRLALDQAAWQVEHILSVRKDYDRITNHIDFT